MIGDVQNVETASAPVFRRPCDTQEMPDNVDDIAEALLVPLADVAIQRLSARWLVGRRIA